MSTADTQPVPHRDRIDREARQSVPCAIATVSDTRTFADDRSGALIESGLLGSGHIIATRTIVRDEPDRIEQTIREAIRVGAAVLITNGGTGIAKRDATFETIDHLLERRIPGFGELFRSLSYAEIGAAAMLTRATAGTIGSLLAFCLPGSPHAVQLGMERLILPELAHLVWETTRD